jgi:F-type H+-transporting ATPase subunit epsilon
LRLKILVPSEILIDIEVAKVIAEAENGYFCLLPRHVDFVAALVPGILSCTTISRQEKFIAIDGGILVKCGSEVLVSTRNALYGPDLGKLKQAVEQQFQVLDEREKMARAALAKLEATFIRQFIEQEKHGSR